MFDRIVHTVTLLGRDRCGSMVIETALVAPILAVLALGGFEASSIVARQSELQSAAAEAAAIVRASPPETTTERNTIRDVIANSAGLSTSAVTVDQVYRCGTGTDYTSTAGSCDTDLLSTYIEIDLQATYRPIWTDFGIGSNVSLDVARTVLVG